MPSVFICHASEDKPEVARPLAEALRDAGVDVWFDEFSLGVGDSLRGAIEKGLLSAEHGIVILSPAFFSKAWTQHELNGMNVRQLALRDRPFILPVWHNIDQIGVAKHSLTLADRLAVPFSDGLDRVVAKLLEVIRPKKTAFVVAKERLEALGYRTPSLTDECWLDWAELAVDMHNSPAPADRWTFPAPFPHEAGSSEKGMNIAFAAMQVAWCEEGQRANVTQLSRPERVHDFLQANNALKEATLEHPEVLALYAPQLTIPGYDGDYAGVFNALLDPTNENAFEMPGYDGWGTRDGRRPACGELIAWRHPELGNLKDESLARSFVEASSSDYSRYSHPAFSCLVWLLSDDADWLPDQLRAALERGFRSDANWLDRRTRDDNAMVVALYSKTRKAFRLTKSIRSAINEMVGDSVRRTGLEGDVPSLTDRFLDRGFIDGWYEKEERNARARRRR